VNNGRIWLSVWSLVLLSATANADDRLTITGSSTIAPLVLEIAKRYEKQNSGVRIDVQTGGSSRGLMDARRGTADIGMVSRALRKEEGDFEAHLLALDGVAMIVHRDNPTEELSDQQVASIYTDTDQTWEAFGGPDMAITVVHKAEGRATQEVFLRHFDLKNSEIRPDVIVGENLQALKTVAGNPWSIAYVSIGTADYEAKRGTAIRLLPLAGVAPTVENVRDGSYPMSRPLNLVTSVAPRGVVKDFISFSQSSAVNDLIKAQYFVPIAE
jgi:phosphate transport system substrate-binding protein